MSTGRTWVPEEYLDEVTPPGKSDPSEWIDDLGGGKYRLLPGWDSDEQTKELSLGDVVPFYWCDALGTVSIRVKSDGTYEVIGGKPDPSATHFWAIGDADSLAHTLDEFAKAQAETFTMGGDDAQIDEEEIEVQMATWAEKGVPCTLILESGRPKFVMTAVQ